MPAWVVWLPVLPVSLVLVQLPQTRWPLTVRVIRWLWPVRLPLTWLPRWGMRPVLRGFRCLPRSTRLHLRRRRRCCRPHCCAVMRALRLPRRPALPRWSLPVVLTRWRTRWGRRLLRVR